MTCAVWESLHYLLRSLLAWEHPAAGLAWWYAAGKPVHESPLLDAVARIWDRGGWLDYYAAWAWTQPCGDTVYGHEDWWRQFRSRPEPRGHNPFFGGQNPLHLEHSDRFGLEKPETDHARLHFDKAARRAVLIVNCLGTWRRDLQRAGNELPNLGDRSWHVEVFDRQTGFLGVFRRSRETGRWFQGKHHIHQQGNPPKAREEGI